MFYSDGASRFLVREAAGKPAGAPCDGAALRHRRSRSNARAAIPGAPDRRLCSAHWKRASFPETNLSTAFSDPALGSGTPMVDVCDWRDRAAGRLGPAALCLGHARIRFVRCPAPCRHVSPACAPSGGVAPLPGVTQQRTERPHTTSAFRSRWLAHGAAWDGIPVSRISKSNGHGEGEQYDRKSLQHSVFLPRYSLMVRLTHQLASPAPIAEPKNTCVNPW
jgi:hypothetical protein